LREEDVSRMHIEMVRGNAPLLHPDLDGVGVGVGHGVDHLLLDC
jgi:hypothetical protein